MSDLSGFQPAAGPLGPDEVARRSFSVSFRGFDQNEVRAFLAQAAAELRAARAIEAELRRRLDDIERDRGDVAFDEDQMTAALGQEAAKLLQAARDGAAEVRERAEREAAEVRDAAERVLAERTGEADAVAQRIREDAERRAEMVIEKSREKGREMVTEAQAVRERILRDLARRRRLAHQQLEQLRAGRERLLESYRVVRQTLDEATRELTIADSEARAAADAAGLRVETEVEPSVAELEADVAAARDVDLPLVEAEEAEGRRETGETEPVAEDEDAEAPGPPGPTALSGTDPDLSGVRIVGAASGKRSPVRRLRRRGGDPSEPKGAEQVPASLTPIGVGDEIEGVRVIAGDDEPEARTGPETGPETGTETETGAEAGAEAGTRTETESRSTVDDLFARLRAGDAGDPAEAGAGEPAAEPPSDIASTSNEATESADEAAEVDAADARPAPLQRRDEAVAPIAEALTRALKRLFADEQNEVLDALRRHRGTPKLDDVLPDAEQHVARYRYAVQPLLADAAAAGAASADASPPSSDAGTVAAALADDVVSALRDRVESACGARNGEPEDGADADTAGAISAAYREWKLQRAEAVAQQHAAAAYSLGRYQAIPEGEPVTWLVDPTGGCGPDCDDNALAGELPRGEPFPTGHAHPPAHGGCRCLLVSGTI